MSDFARLPPLTALRAFEAAARHMSFAKAAEELFVTPAALSFQIKSLEEALGLALFRRLNRAVELTDAGRALQPHMTQGFEALAEGIRALHRLQNSAAFTVTAGPAFTAKWLAPRFFHFVQDHPEIELRFVASLKIMDFSRDEVDAAIRYGVEGPTDVYWEDLIDDWVVPVAAPDLAEQIKSPEDLADMTLLHDDSLSFLERPPSWQAWCDAVGAAIAPELTARGPRFTGADHVIDAAVAGAGIALARASLIERDLTANRLVTPFRCGLDARGKFRFVCPKGQETQARTATFLEWIREEARSLAVLRRDFEILPLLQ